MGMTPAEVKCLREAMGLPTKWLAIRWSVAEFSVKRWETGRALPPDLEADLLDLKALFDRTVAEAAATPGDGCLLVPRTDRDAEGGFPSAWYRAIAYRAAERCHCHIGYKDDDQ